MLKWYYDQITIPFLFTFQKYDYKYLPYQILGHDFDEKSDFFGPQIVDKTARHYSIQKWPSSKESWVEGRCD